MCIRDRYECVGGFFKGVIGYLILMVGANGLITTCLLYTSSMVTEEGGALYILDRNNDILMEYNEKYQKQLKELREQETVKAVSYTHLDVYKRQVLCTLYK